MREEYVINQVKQIQLPSFQPSPIYRKKVIFSGRVQNVGFRLEIFELAKRLELMGWVKNRDDKNVEAEIQGENEKIEFLIEFMKSLKRASVREIQIDDLSIAKEEKGFNIEKGEVKK